MSSESVANDGVAGTPAPAIMAAGESSQDASTPPAAPTGSPPSKTESSTLPATTTDTPTAGATATTESSTSPSSTTPEDASSSTPPAAANASVSSNNNNNNSTSNMMVFPCIEQPLRITLFCNGYYMWGIRGNRVIARKRRSEKDEFRLQYTDKENGIVEIYNHKFGGALSVVVDDATGASKVVCVKQDSATTTTGGGGGGVDTATAQGEAGETVADGEDTTSFNNDPDEVFDDEPAVDLATTITTEEDRKWCFIRGAHGNDNDSGGTQVMLKSLRTGENLSVDAKGKIVLVADTTDMTDSSRNLSATPDATTWDIDCVTGELCFLPNANQALNRRLRCDMAGLLTLTEAWKGWEVFRMMEATHGYVKISSWMHSQWLLCSTADGGVTTCSHAESMMEHNPKGCCQWAIEKYIPNESDTSGLQGVIIRSKTYGGRLLSIDDGVLKTYSETDIPPETMTDNMNPLSATTDQTQPTAVEGNNNTAKVNKWWNNSVKSMNASVKNIQRRMSSASLNAEGGDEDPVVIAQKETTVWQVEAAHLQTYYFAATVEEGEKPKTVGPFPYVTPNLRQNDKIQITREGLVNATRLYETEKKQYIACSTEGIISFVDAADDNPDTEWVLDKPQYQGGGNVFRSKPHNLYLSYEVVMGEEPDTDNETQPETHSERFNKLFNKKTEPVATLVGSETLGPREVWKLEPCMPRAVSSEKITTFAIGTSIAVGTTIAMPFALAGAGAILGAVGAEAGVLFNAIAVGLTGAEALASVGAIGATAYIVFRPEDNSLTDDHKNDEEDAAERAWSKRPFSNWRNW